MKPKKHYIPIVPAICGRDKLCHICYSLKDKHALAVQEGAMSTLIARKMSACSKQAEKLLIKTFELSHL
ncbi:MAG: hypothetical protein HY363_01480 [Candidatus Aenigmarchaeota archaeon]|nr:hypothetical protein [Candidatus Aenigmarchaeota archaeon]